MLREEIEPDEEQPSVLLAALRKKIEDIAFNVYQKYRERKVSNPEFTLLLGAADNNSTILYVTCEGKTQILNQFGIIGSGRITGGELLLEEFFQEKMTRNRAAYLAYQVISRVGHIDLSVGGIPDIQLCQNRLTWVYKKDVFAKIKSKSDSQWNLMKKVLWKIQNNEELEDKIKELIK